MNEIKRLSRVTTALQVIQRMNEGLSVMEACNEVGMPRSTYYYIIARETEAIAEFQDMVVANSRENLWMILVNQNMLLQKIIEDGLTATTKPRERLAIYKALGERLEKLSQALQMSSHDDAFATEFLKGPTLVPGKSRFAASSTTE
jgi:hypothetical protein